MNGMEMMLKSFGLDPKKLIADFEQLKALTTGTLAKIDERLADIQARQIRMEERQEEIWKANQVALSRSSQIQLVQQPPQQSPLPEQQPVQNTLPPMPPEQPNQQPRM